MTYNAESESKSFTYYVDGAIAVLKLHKTVFDIY
jgi:hypothetical protein